MEQFLEKNNIKAYLSISKQFIHIREALVKRIVRDLNINIIYYHNETPYDTKILEDVKLMIVVFKNNQYIGKGCYTEIEYAINNGIKVIYFDIFTNCLFDSVNKLIVSDSWVNYATVSKIDKSLLNLSDVKNIINKLCKTNQILFPI